MAEGQQAFKLNFFVYIVESPSAPDLYHGRSEGNLVAQAIALDGIRCVTRMAINRTAFVAALRIGLPEVMKEFPDRLPIVHISAHGGKEGIQLSSGDLVNWDDLRELLLPINESLSGTLLLCMSACQGYHAGMMAMQEEESPHPYLAMIGHCGQPTWADTAVSYLVFYHRLSRGHLIRDAVEGMKAACGDSDWRLETADELKHSYLEYIKSKQVQPADARRELETVAQEEDVPSDAKALEAASGG